MERTNDRDYEIEERYEEPLCRWGYDNVLIVGIADGIGQWRRLRTGCRRKQRGTWIHCEVGGVFMEWSIPSGKGMAS